MVGLKLKNFSSEDDQFERLLMIEIKLKIVFSEDGHFWRLSTVEMRLKNFSFARRLILAIMNGQNRVLGIFFFVDIGRFLPLLTVKIELNNFSLSNNGSTNQIAQKRVI